MSHPFMLCACPRYSFAEMEQSKLITYSIVFVLTLYLCLKAGGLLFRVGDFGVSVNVVARVSRVSQSFCLSDWM
jgi:hypothetical protein